MLFCWIGPRFKYGCLVYVLVEFQKFWNKIIFVSENFDKMKNNINCAEVLW